MRRALALAGALMALLGGSAQARTLIVAPEGSQVPYQRWVDEAKVPTAPVTVSVIAAESVVGCPQNEAFACSDGYSTVWLGTASPRANLYHELGHVFEYFYLREDPAARDRIAELIAHPKMAWAPWGTEWGLAALNEAFAMSYAQCARLPRIDPKWEYTIGVVLLAGWRLRKICGLIRTYPA